MLLLRLRRLGLLKRYEFLAAYLAFSVATSLVLVCLARVGRPFYTEAYAWTYLARRPVLWTFYFALIVGFFAAMLEQYPGIRRLGWMAFYSGLAVAGLIGGALVVLNQGRDLDPYPLLSSLVVHERSVFLCLGALTLLLLSFAVHFRLRIRRNVWLFYACWGGYFVANAALLTLREHLGLAFAPTRSLLNAVVYFLALLAATVFLSRRGEAAAAPLRAPDRELEAALGLQLSNLNQVLVKVLRQ